METIPGPYRLPLVGNLFDIRHEDGLLKGAEHLADIYGPVFQLTLGGKTSVFVSSAELLKQFTNEKQFVKTPPAALSGGNGVKGLFVAASDDPDWHQAHKILTPAFGPLPVGDMFEGMRDIATQLCLKWARMGEDHEFLLTDDFTRLTLDTIALCTMDYRFNSFYSDNMHPFVEAMIGVLSYSGKRANLPALYTKVFGASEEVKLQEDGATMTRIAQEIINRRRQNPFDKPDMLNTLLYGKDPKTGKPMRDELITANMINFLVAGHETTSGLLSFLFVNLMQNPKTYLKAREEVDHLVGTETIQLHHLKELKYLNASLRETLRVRPTAPVIIKKIPDHRKDEFVTICDGRYYIPQDVSIRILLGKAMCDPSYFGEDAHEFNPDRMLETNPNFDKHMAAWKPFGNGSRACIGQGFAWQETLLVAALVTQNFDISLVDPSYVLRVKQTLTIKPKDLLVRARLRKGVSPMELDARLHGNAANLKAQDQADQTNGAAAQDTTPRITIFYGSNSGTCYSLAQKLASAVTIKLGIVATVSELDSGVDNLSPTQPVVIITASYEGQPPDNAARFVAWIESSNARNLSEVNYAVFGCGHKDWRDTLYRIPKLVDRIIGERGGSRLLDLGTSDVSQGAVLDDFEKWQQQLLEKLKREYLGSNASIASQDLTDLVQVSKDTRAIHLSSGLSLGKVIDVKVLTGLHQPEKRHMEIQLPPTTMYECGDYLAVLPMNSESLVRSVMAHWELPWDATIIFKSKAFGNVPVDKPVSIFELLKGYFELSQQATRTNLNDCKRFTENVERQQRLQQCTADESIFNERIVSNHFSLFDVLTLHPEIKMPFANFLSNLLPLHVRQYSISSSPIRSQQTCTITYSVIKNASAVKDAEGSALSFEGVASSYLASLKPGDTFQMAVRTTATANLPCAFRLPPAVQAMTPLLMFCAGTGLAPFRGFVQQRATMLEENPSLELAPALLFVGCRSSTGDRLYAAELGAWQKLGAVDVRYAFSQEPDHELAAGCKYVGDRIAKDLEDVTKLWREGAKVYICGGRRVQDSVRKGVNKIFEEFAKKQQWTDEVKKEKEEGFKAAVAARAVSDIFD